MTLSGCETTAPPPVVKTEVVYRTAPAAYTVGCQVPPFTGTTWADLAADNAALIAVIEACDKRFEYLREWGKPPPPIEPDPMQKGTTPD